MRDPSPAERCLRMAARQYGVLSRAQALASGLSRDQVHRLKASGCWDLVLPGIYRPAGAPATWEQNAERGSPLGGTRRGRLAPIGSGQWELSGSTRRWIEISSPRQRHAPEGVIVHRVKDLAACVGPCSGWAAADEPAPAP
jgi:hypothetical protein